MKKDIRKGRTTSVSRDLRGGSKSREHKTSMSLECSVIVRRSDELVRVAPHQNKEEEWQLDLLYEAVPPFEVTLPQLHHLQLLKITTRTIPEDLKNVTSLSLVNGDLEGFPSVVCQLHKLTQLINSL